MQSVRSIAKQAGVSTATVSRVLNAHPQVRDETRKRVEAVARRHNYSPTVGRRSTRNIALVYTGAMSLGSPFDASILQGMTAGLQQYGYDLLITSAARIRASGETWMHAMMQRGVAGLVIRTDQDTRPICEEILEEGIKGIVLADEFPNPHLRTLVVDARKAVRQAMEHLVHIGHRRIAVVLNVVDDHDHRQRLEVCREVLTELGVGLTDRMILRTAAFIGGGEAAMRQIMGMPERPTAVFVTDPLSAIGMLNEAQRMGVSIPRDLSVIGFDDSQQRFGLYPRMSAVCQDAAQLGGEALRLLMEAIDTSISEVVPPRLECWLELNDSTAKPPGV